MEKVGFWEHKGKKIFYADFSGINIKNKPEIIAIIESAKAVVAQQPEKSLLILTNVTNTGFDSEVTGIFKDYASHNTKYVKASALVGISGLQKVILTAVKQFTKRDYNLFNTVDEAKDWLTAQE